MSNIPPSLPPQASSPTSPGSDGYQTVQNIITGMMSLSKWPSIDGMFDRLANDAKGGNFDGAQFKDPFATPSMDPYFETLDSNGNVVSNPNYTIGQAIQAAKEQFEQIKQLYNEGQASQSTPLYSVLTNNLGRLGDIFYSKQ